MLVTRKKSPRLLKLSTKVVDFTIEIRGETPTISQIQIIAHAHSCNRCSIQHNIESSRPFPLHQPVTAANAKINIRRRTHAPKHFANSTYLINNGPFSVDSIVHTKKDHYFPFFEMGGSTITERSRLVLS